MADSFRKQDFPLLTEEELSALQACGRVRRRPPGTTLFIEGEDADSALLIRRGHVKIVAGQPPRFVAIRSSGEYIGEIAVIREVPRTATAIAFDDVEVLEVADAQWIQFLYDHPRAMHALLRETAQRSEQATRKVTDSELAVEQRLAKAFLELVEAGIGEDSGEGLMLRLNQLDQASLIGASVDSVKKAVKKFKKAGLIRTGREVTTLLNPAVMGQIADGDMTAAAWLKQGASDAGPPV